MRQFTISFATVAISVFLLTVLAERLLIPILRSRKAGQIILDIGPRWHKYKEGTPTMGGLGFILPVLLVMAVYFILAAVEGNAARLIPLALVLAYAVGNGAVGFVDDYCKLIKKQNEGLSEIQKLLLQLVLASAYVCVMAYTGNMDTRLLIPFFNIEWELGWVWYPLAVVILAGVVNGANFTDGIDGLASSVTFVIGGFFAVWAFAVFDEQISMVAALLLGATLGFLVYNFHPAKVFMGDTGSLFIGALVIATTLQAGKAVVGLIVSGIYLLELLSSFLQKTFFKLTRRFCKDHVGRRIFKMAPLHHHFEKCGWNEYQIVSVFSAVELLFCIIAWFAL